MKNLVRIIPPMLIKLRAAHKWKIHISHKESRKKVKEFEKSNFVCAFAFKIYTFKKKKICTFFPQD